MHLLAFIFLHIKKACTHKENLKMSMHGHMAVHRNHHESRAYQLSLFKRQKERNQLGKKVNAGTAGEEMKEASLTYVIGVTAH